MYLSVYQGHNQHRTRQFARVDAASRWLDEQMPSNAELAGTCFINEVGEFVESELRAAVEDGAGGTFPVFGWIIDLDWEQPA